MKKLLFILVTIAALLGLFAEEELVWCAKIVMGEATIHTIQQGESLSKISKNYYGTAEYWRELSLINRAPNSDYVQVGERIIVPNLEGIQEIRSAPTMTGVNAVVKVQELLIAGNISPQSQPAVEKPVSDKPLASVKSQSQMQAQPVQEPAPIYSQKKSGGPSMITILSIIVLGVLGLSWLGNYIYKRVKQQKGVFAGKAEKKMPYSKLSRESDEDFDESYQNRKKEVLAH